MHQTKIFPVFVVAGLMGVALLIPFASKLPFTFQRTLAFLPLHINETARRDAEGSAEWRLQIWKDALEIVPQYLLLGKGYALSQEDLAMAGNRGFRDISNARGSVGTTGNWHSGPLSVVIPFGIWGAIAIIWFWAVSLRALYLNYRYGDAVFGVINKFLFAWYVAKIFMFLIIFGDLSGDMQGFIGIIGISIALNRGIRKPVLKPAAPARAAFPAFQPQFQPSFRR